MAETEVEIEETNLKNFYYPPGGILMWIIIFIELFTFGILLIVMVSYGKEDPVLFHESKLMLNIPYGVVNTVFLLTSGFFMVRFLQHQKNLEYKKAKMFLILTMLGGLAFLLLKGVEYSGKIDAGLTFGYNTFFTFYWMLTGFHVIHVIVGLIILGSILIKIVKYPTKMNQEDVDASVTFWHMCDLIWLLLFPIIYLFF